MSGFDLPDGEREIWQAVEYLEEPAKLTHLDYNTANSMIFTKYADWQYEGEIRVWANLGQKSGDYYFHEFDDDLRLKEVIVGAANPASGRRILQALGGSHQDDVRILKARLAYNAFKVVEDENGLVR